MNEYQKRGYLLENFRLFHLRSHGGEQVEYHYHEFCKVLLLISGSGGYFVDGQRYLLQTGDIVLIGNHSIHRPEMDGGSPYERIILYISPEYLQRESTAECNLLSVFSGEKGHVLRLKENRKQKIFQLAAALEQDLEGNDFGREIVSNAGLLRLLVEIGRNMRREESFGPSPAVPKSPRILAMATRISKRPNHIIRIIISLTMFDAESYPTANSPTAVPKLESNAIEQLILPSPL